MTDTAEENFYVLHKESRGFFGVYKPYPGINAVPFFEKTELFR